MSDDYEFIRMEDEYLREQAELRDVLRELGEDEETIERIMKDSLEHPFGRDARDCEDEYPHGGRS